MADFLALLLWRRADGVTFGGSPSSCATSPTFYAGRRGRRPGDARHHACVGDGCTFLVCYFLPAEALLAALGRKLADTTLRDAAHALTLIFGALAALPPDDTSLSALGIMSASSARVSAVATLRQFIASHLGLWEQQCVAVSLAEAVAMRVTLVVDHGGCVSALLHLCPDAAAVLRVGGLLMLLGPAAQVRLCDGRPRTRARSLLAASSALPLYFFACRHDFCPAP